MLKRIRTIYFPNICITFTLVTVSLCILYLIFGGNFNRYPAVALWLVALLILATGGCVLVNKIKFKKKIMYPIMELLVNYVVFLGADFLLGHPGLLDLILTGIMVPVFYFVIYFRIQKQCRKEAGKINKLLQNRREEAKGKV